MVSCYIAIENEYSSIFAYLKNTYIVLASQEARFQELYKFNSLIVIPCDTGFIIFFTLQMKKLRNREIRLLAKCQVLKPTVKLR